MRPSDFKYMNLDFIVLYDKMSRSDKETYENEHGQDIIQVLSLQTFKKAQ